MDANYGGQIRAMRKSFGFTQADYAQKAGISLSSLKRYEANERQPTMAVLDKLAHALGMTTPEFLWKQASPSTQTNHVAGQTLRNLREKKGLTLQETSLLTGLSEHTLSAYESGNKALRVRTLQVFADAFDVPPADLFSAMTPDARHSGSTYFYSYTGDSNQDRLLDAFFALNESGQAKVIAYATDLADLPKYKATDAASTKEDGAHK